MVLAGGSFPNIKLKASWQITVTKPVTVFTKPADKCPGYVRSLDVSPSGSTSKQQGFNLKR